MENSKMTIQTKNLCLTYKLSGGSLDENTRYHTQAFTVTQNTTKIENDQQM